MLPYFDNNEFIEKQYDLTLGNILTFLSYPNIQAQEISFEKDAWYCKFGNSNEITPNGFPRFFLIGKLIREHFLLSDMKDYICTFRPETKELKEFMEWMRMKDKHFILPGLKKEYNTAQIFSSDIGFHHFMSIVDVGDDFNMQIRTAPYFIDSFFQFLNSYKFKEDINEDFVNTGLYKDIIDHTGGKRNFRDSITLQYNIEDYVYKKRVIHKTLSKLQESKNLKIQNTILNEFTISFVLNSFVDFDVSLFGIEQTEEKIEEKKNDSGLLFDEDTGKITYNGEFLVQLKLGKNDYKFIQVLHLSKGKSVSYEEIKNHIKSGKISSTHEQYCHKIKCDLPEDIKNYVISTGNGYMLDIQAIKG